MLNQSSKTSSSKQKHKGLRATKMSQNTCASTVMTTLTKLQPHITKTRAVTPSAKDAGLKTALNNQK